MLNFPQMTDEQIRRTRAHLLTPQADPVWHGAVTQLLHMLIDADLAEHRAVAAKEQTAKVPSPTKESKKGDVFAPRKELVQNDEAQPWKGTRVDEARELEQKDDN